MPKQFMGVMLLVCMTQASAQTVEVEMETLKRLADDCSASLSVEGCRVTRACQVLKRYSLALMPDGPAGYYDRHASDGSMNLGNGKLVTEAVTAVRAANKAAASCAPG